MPVMRKKPLNFDSVTFQAKNSGRWESKSIWHRKIAQKRLLHIFQASPQEIQPLITLLICKTNIECHKLSFERLCNAETMSNLILLHFLYTVKLASIYACKCMTNVDCISLKESDGKWNTEFSAGIIKLRRLYAATFLRSINISFY